MELELVKKLMAELEGSELSKLVFKKGDFELHLEKGKEILRQMVEAQPEVIHAHKPAPKVEVAHGKSVTSPMVGTFYASPSPDQPNFVKVGDKVTENTVVCIVEAMKVMNEVKAGISGTIAEILVDNAHPVEFGTKLYRIV